MIILLVLDEQVKKYNNFVFLLKKLEKIVIIYSNIFINLIIFNEDVKLFFQELQSMARPPPSLIDAHFEYFK